MAWPCSSGCARSAFVSVRHLSNLAEIEAEADRDAVVECLGLDVRDVAADRGRAAADAGDVVRQRHVLGDRAEVGVAVFEPALPSQEELGLDAGADRSANARLVPARRSE